MEIKTTLNAKQEKALAKIDAYVQSFWFVEPYNYEYKKFVVDAADEITMISFTIGRVGDEGTANELWGRRTWIMVLKPGGGVTSYKTKKNGTTWLSIWVVTRCRNGLGVS